MPPKYLRQPEAPTIVRNFTSKICLLTTLGAFAACGKNPSSMVPSSGTNPAAGGATASGGSSASGGSLGASGGDTNAEVDTLLTHAGTTRIGSRVSTSWGDNVIKIGEGNLDENRRFVRDNFNTVQLTTFPAWGDSVGMWPTEKPSSIANAAFNVAEFNALVDWTKENSLGAFGLLSLASNFYCPAWFDETSYSPEELEEFMNDYLDAFITSTNAANVHTWNLTNELFVDNYDDTLMGKYKTSSGASNLDRLRWADMGSEADASGLTDADKINETHPIFIRKAFERALKLDPDARFELREFNIEFSIIYGKTNLKKKAMAQLVKHLLAKGIPAASIAVGYQAHFNRNNHTLGSAPYDWEDFETNIDFYKALGVDVYINELDVGLYWDELSPGGGAPLPSVDWSSFETEQSWTYYNAVRSARRAGVSVINTWGFLDGSMGEWRSGQNALYLSSDYKKKAAYSEIVRALSETR